MSYHPVTRPLVRLPAASVQPVALAGLWSAWTDIIHTIVTGGEDESQIDPTCHAASQTKTAALDAQTNELAKTWKPYNDLYSVAGMTRARDATLTLLAAASQGISALISGGNDAIKVVGQQALGRLTSKQADAATYTQAIDAATARGLQVIRAPGFKDWVINSMNAASVAIGYAEYVGCITPALAKIGAAFIGTARAAWSKLVAVAKALETLAEDVGKFALEIPKTATDVLKYLKYGAAVAGGYWLYKFLTKHTS